MEAFCGISEKYTGKKSEKFVNINNFGYYKNVNTLITTSRPHGRPDYQMIYVKNGEVTFMSHKGIKKATSGTLILFRPFETQIYSYKPAENSHYLWLHFSGTGIETLLAGLFTQTQTLKLDDELVFLDAFESMKSFCIRYDDIAAQFAEGNFIRMTAELKRCFALPDQGMIEKVIYKMRSENINDNNNEDYAKMCDISEYHFIRKFKAVTGSTPHQYKTRIIVYRGADLLRNTDMSISEIAFTLGFEDSLYFSRVFKKTIGISPNTYRNRMNKQ